MSSGTKLFALALLAGAAWPVASLAETATAETAAPIASSVAEVVVTAQKRSEKLVDVPVSMVAVSGGGLAKSGVTGVLGLSQAVPGLRLDLSGSFVEPSIRGVGTEISGSGSNPNVPIYIDGIVRPNPLGNDFNFIDVDSIQVLKGPQGTLFGRNATGGAIVITTKSPSFHPQLEVKAGYGSFNTVRTSVYATGPIAGDMLAGSIAAGYEHSDGWIHNDTTGKLADRSDSYTVRGKLEFVPTNWAKFTLTGDIGRVNDPYAYATTSYHGLSFGAVAPPIGPGVPVITNDTGHINLNGYIAHIQAQEGVELKSEFNLGFATLTSYTGYRWQHGQEFLDIDASPAPIYDAGWHDRAQTFSQEFDLGHSGGRLDWVAGLYYYNDYEAFDNPGFVASAGGAPYALLWSDNQTSESYAVFGDVTYNLGNWHFTLGGRLSDDSAQSSYTAYAPPPTTLFASPKKTWGSFTPRAVVRYSLTPDSNVYVSFSEGNKAGQFNAQALNVQITPVAPEHLTDFEVGYKISKPRWDLQVSGFHYDYKNLQIQTVRENASFLESARRSEMYGFDFNGRFRLTDDLTVTGGGAYTHARYTDFRCPPGAGPTALCGALEYVPDPVVPHLIDTLTQQNVSGFQMERTPEFSGNIGLDYVHPLFGGSIELNGAYSFQTRVYFDANQGATQGAYGVLNLRVAWTDPSRRLTLSLSGQNVTNQSYISQVLEQGPLQFGQTFGEPASVFFEVGYKY